MKCMEAEMSRYPFPVFRQLAYVLCGSVLLAVGLPAALLAQGAGYWHTSGNKVLDANGTQVRIAGINWYGFETSTAVANGLTAQDYKTILQTVKSLGYNTIRLPFSNQVVETPSYPNISYSNGNGAINTDLQGLNSLQIMDKMVAYAGTIGLKIILDNHRSEAGNSAEGSGLWFTGSYPESSWINDWTMLANRYLNNPTVVGFDLRNEPHNAFSGGACWSCGGTNDWHLAAERAGNAVLGVNPKLLIFVEGVDAYTSSDYYWWGGNLEGVSSSPVTLSVANQLVYSAHDYGPAVYGQSWFNGSTTAASLNSVWTTHWGYVAKNGIAPVWLGEFGTPNDAASVQNSAAGSEGQWFQSLVSYLAADPTLNWTYWALNGEDQLALLDSNYDATPVNSIKQSMLASIQFPLNPGSATPPVAPAAPSGLTASAASASTIYLSWSASSTSGVSYTVYFGTSSGTTTALVSGLMGTSYTASGLSASTTYSFTVKAVSASAGSSAASNQASATTQAAAAPAAPTGLTAAASSSSQINLSWTASATGGVTYSVFSGTGAGALNQVASGVGGTSYSATGLTASTTYSFAVKAVSSSGGTSAASNQASAATQAAAAAGACHIAYVDQNDWGSGFTGNLSITNSGSTALSSWTVTWSYAGNQAINQSWNGNYSQSGKTVSIMNASWNGSIAAGATLTGIGWNANYSGTNASPTVFYLNGVLCR